MLYSFALAKAYLLYSSAAPLHAANFLAGKQGSWCALLVNIEAVLFNASMELTDLNLH
jgi:hypothetical protein